MNKIFIKRLILIGALIFGVFLNSFAQEENMPAKATEEAAVEKTETAPAATGETKVNAYVGNDYGEQTYAAGEAPSTLDLTTATANQAMFSINTIWILLAAALVFIMHLGFSTLEIGLTRAKNTTNILFKNVSIVAIGLITYAICGFNLMYGEGGAYIGSFTPFTPDDAGNTMGYSSGHYTVFADFIFQGMFAATAATIVSGAIAERVKINSFLVFSVIYVGICYPIMGRWTWAGDGFLCVDGFKDFAGSTLVHSVGGWAALAAILVLGPRIGKFGVDGKARAIPGHSMPLAAIGVFLLFFGWFGFNGGSVLSADPVSVSRVFVTTALAGAAGIIGSMITSIVVLKTYDLSMVLNGALAGLVGITAGADVISVWDSTIVGAIAGVIVVFAVIGFDKIKIDDPVGATSVHLVCGIWGTLAVGIFSADHSFMTQFKGVAIYGIAAFGSAMLVLLPIKAIMGFRVSKEEEITGLDIEEHGMEAYAGFQIFTNQ